MILVQYSSLAHTVDGESIWMIEPEAGRDHLSWRLPLYAVLCAVFVMILLFVYDKDPVLSYLFLMLPAGCLAFLVVLVVAIIKRTRKSFSVVLAVVVFMFGAGALLATQNIVRPSLRWLLWSRRLKAEVLAQATPVNEEFKHIEWDGWGGAPVGDWTAYVVFDPRDALSSAAKSRSYGRFGGIPCNVDRVRRLERNWYSVELSMNEWWDQCVSFAQEKPAQPVLKVSVMADGRIAVNRAPATIQSLRESLQKLSQQKGVVCYYREAANSEGSPKVKQAVQAIVDARLPVRFSSRPDYSDVIGPDGKPIKQ